MELHRFLILLILALPALGAIICAFLKSPQSARTTALVVSGLCLLFTIPLLAKFDWQSSQPLGAQFNVPIASIESIGFTLHVGVDGISIWLLALTTFLMPL